MKKNVFIISFSIVIFIIALIGFASANGYSDNTPIPNLFGGREPGDYLKMLAIGENDFFIAHPCLHSIQDINNIEATDACIVCISIPLSQSKLVNQGTSDVVGKYRVVASFVSSRGTKVESSWEFGVVTSLS